ncbi:ogr/Delta-like zinc finger family protein [Pedomonas sp.]|uniref:ogr/Delta-like zinc finger family protein n=1 Tax=Pedomonas sp. TaxID=2976421 RepID=UPI0039C9B5B3
MHQLRKAPRLPAMQCPHCTAPAAARTSRAVTALYREIHYQCSDVECGHTFAASLSVMRTISPSAKPNPGIVLPLSARRKAEQPA